MDELKLNDLIEEGKRLLATKKTVRGEGWGDGEYVDNELYIKWMTKVEIILKTNKLEEYIVDGKGRWTTNYELAKGQIAKLEGIKEALF